MAKRSFGPKGSKPSAPASHVGGPRQTSATEFVRKLKEEARKAAPYMEEYRRRSLEIHGNLCAKCGREFSGKELRLLTVHHKDGNHHNNPRDGSNWENLCVYCHDDEHSREILAGYLSQGGRGAGGASAGEPAESGPSAEGFNPLRDALEKALKKGRG
ncbi:MAG: YajD family HNH nuclease [bacterium]